jgi:monooxygenase
VTMLQRSPHVLLRPPTTHELAVTLRALDIPRSGRTRSCAASTSPVRLAGPDVASRRPTSCTRSSSSRCRPLLPEGFDIEKHFTPRYRPWQQRIAVVPDGDLFAALREGKASVVTDTIETFTETGIRVSSGEELEADVVVTATGFNLSLFGDVAFTVDGEPVDFTERVTWRGIMISGVPNMAYVFGYFRHSWTLRVDLVSDLVCRLLEHMQDKGATMVVPTLRPEDAGHAAAAVVGPGELQRRLRHALAAPLFKQGDREPWTHMHEHDEEREILPKADLDDGSLVYR